MVALSWSIEHGRRHLRVAEYGGPFAAAEFGRDDDAVSLLEFTRKVEEQGAAPSAERRLAKNLGLLSSAPCEPLDHPVLEALTLGLRFGFAPLLGCCF